MKPKFDFWQTRLGKMCDRFYRAHPLLALILAVVFALPLLVVAVILTVVHRLFFWNLDRE